LVRTSRALKARPEYRSAPPARIQKDFLIQTFHVWLPSFAAAAATLAAAKPLILQGFRRFL
jgi:hypothetical protein